MGDNTDTQLAPLPAGLTTQGRPRSRGRRDVYKRIIVACDGTWLNSDNGMTNGDVAVPSNVTRMLRAIKTESSDGIQQIGYYHEGIGTSGGIVEKVVGGLTGEGLASDVREAYSFIANNYQPGDEIFLLGFSRGAYTARSVAGLIGEVGLLTKRGLQSLVEVYRDVRHRRDAHYRPKNPNIPFPNKPSASNPAYREELERRGLSTLGIHVKAIGVWDTVGSLGAPRISILTKLGIQPAESSEMSFYDTKLSNCVENAFQALALDERRTSFAPAVWEKPPGNRTVLRQVWFPGVHSNVGGGYDDQQLANITLAWMVAQLEPFLDISMSYVMLQDEENAQFYRGKRRKIRPWSFGKICNSLTGVYALGGGTTRTPGCYYAVDPESGRFTDRPLADTHEYVHPSVRTRFKLRGPGTDDEGRYDPEALDDWKLVVEYPPPEHPDGGSVKPKVYWRARFRDENVSTRVLPESPLWGIERDLLAQDPGMEEAVRNPEPTGMRRRRRRGEEEEFAGEENGYNGGGGGRRSVYGPG
ncbi:hypothetical protein K402DRAFT_337901 [Aulographum hederae CBS 113979]|uniref:T6SS Phospholipase effector Tle1-like catalytic domain-containing protein n=1 Tax=Aulographum hederae CBS 113979 TaxID=1176131 RepID=A0A6G1GSD5_9PEZI|nr:hypothetical protein K402DRAFT_337901 [Aulographum hederae CBS 113979]